MTFLSSICAFVQEKGGRETGYEGRNIVKKLGSSFGNVKHSICNRYLCSRELFI